MSCIYLFAWGYTWVPCPTPTPTLTLTLTLILTLNLNPTSTPTSNPNPANPNPNPNPSPSQVPWFFMLSGFVLTHAKLKSKQPSRRENVALFIKKRTAVIYPVYALSVLLAYLIDWWRDKALPPWYVGLSQGLLAQSWLPWLPEKSVQLHCWFLSAMVPYPQAG